MKLYSCSFVTSCQRSLCLHTDKGSSETRRTATHGRYIRGRDGLRARPPLFSSRKEVFPDWLGLRRAASANILLTFFRKEVFQPHLPVRLPCYDLAPITGFALGRSSRLRTSGAPGFHGLTGGVYKARERIHRAMADARLLANPASWSRVADSSPN